MSTKYPVDEVFNMLGENTLNQTDELIKSESIEVSGYQVYKDSWRYRTFYQKGLKCACCNRVGTYFKLHVDSKNIERAHFNLFAEDGTMMTKDHIIPKSKGGPDCIENFQTMCEECNKEKKDTMPDLIPNVKLNKVPRMEIKATKVGNPKDIHLFSTLEDAVKYVVANILHVYSKKDRPQKEIASMAIRATIKLTTSLNGIEPYCGYNWERI